MMNNEYNFSILSNLHKREDGGNILDESYTALSTRKKGKCPSILLRIDDEDSYGEGFLKDPYIGVYDDYTFNSAKNMVRVGMLTGELLNHRNSGRKSHLGHLPANSDQLKYLLKLMKNNIKTEEVGKNIETVEIEDTNTGAVILIAKKKLEIYQYLKQLAASKDIEIEYTVTELFNFNKYKECRSADKIKDYRK